jgi:hypothetical protein
MFVDVDPPGARWSNWHAFEKTQKRRWLALHARGA